MIRFSEVGNVFKSKFEPSFIPGIKPKERSKEKDKPKSNNNSTPNAHSSSASSGSSSSRKTSEDKRIAQGGVRVIGQEANGVILVARDHNEKTMYIDLIDTVTQETHVLCAHDKGVQIVSASVNEDRSILAITTFGVAAGEGDHAESMYESFLVEIRTPVKCYSLDMRTRQFQRIQFLPPMGSSNIYFLFFLDKETVDLYHIGVEKSVDSGSGKKSATIVSQPYQEESRIVKPVWYEWDPHRSLLYCVTSSPKSPSSSAVEFSFKCCSFASPRHPEILSDIPLPLRLPLTSEREFTQYEELPWRNGQASPDASMRVKVVRIGEEAICLCQQHPRHTPSASPSPSASSASASASIRHDQHQHPHSSFSSSTDEIHCTIYILHHKAKLDIRIPIVSSSSSSSSSSANTFASPSAPQQQQQHQQQQSSSPSSAVPLISYSLLPPLSPNPRNNRSPSPSSSTDLRVNFFAMGDLLVIYLPGHYLHLVDCGPDHDPCDLATFTGDQVPKIPLSHFLHSSLSLVMSPAASDDLSVSLSSHSPSLVPLFMHSYCKSDMLLDIRTGSLYQSEFDSESFFRLFESRGQRIFVPCLHISFAHLKDAQLANRLLSHLFGHLSYQITTEVIQEWLIGSTFLLASTAAAKGGPSIDKQVLRLLPVSAQLKDNISRPKPSSKNHQYSTLAISSSLPSSSSSAGGAASGSNNGRGNGIDGSGGRLPETPKSKPRLQLEKLKSPVILSPAAVRQAASSSYIYPTTPGSGPASALQSGQSSSSTPGKTKETVKSFFGMLLSKLRDPAVESEQKEHAEILDPFNEAARRRFAEAVTEFLLANLPRDARKLCQEGANEYARIACDQSKLLLQLLVQARDEFSLSPRSHFSVLQHYISAVEEMSFPISSDFHEDFTKTAFQVLPRNMFLQYVMRGVVHLSDGFVDDAILSLGDSEQDDHLRYHLISRLSNKQKASELLKMHKANYPFLLERAHSVLPLPSPSAEDAFNVLLQMENGSVGGGPQFAPLAAFLYALDQQRDSVSAAAMASPGASSEKVSGQQQSQQQQQQQQLQLDVLSDLNESERDFLRTYSQWVLKKNAAFA